MTTLNDICERAYRRIQVVAVDEAMTADQAKHAQETYNAMIAGWSLTGVEAPVSPAQLMENFPFPPRFESAIVSLLANELAPDFERPGVASARQAKADIMAYYHVIPTVKMPLALLATNRERGRGRF
jgi:hypothetical protein